MDIDTYNSDISARVVEVFSNDVISCVVTDDIARRFEALTEDERAGIKRSFMHNKDIIRSHIKSAGCVRSIGIHGLFHQKAVQERLAICPVYYFGIGNWRLVAFEFKYIIMK
jgi:hypothetical protein